MRVFWLKFFHEVQQYRQWMMNDLIKAEKLVQRKDVHPNTHAQIANELLLEMKVIRPSLFSLTLCTKISTFNLLWAH